MSVFVVRGFINKDDLSAPERLCVYVCERVSVDRDFFSSFVLSV